MESRGKTRGNGAKRLNAVEQQKEREKEGKALLKQQKADEVAKRHEELEARKRATKEERCGPTVAALILNCEGHYFGGRTPKNLESC